MDHIGHVKKTDVIKRSIFINGHKTSVSLENEFWQGLHEIADHDHASVAKLVEQIDRARNTCNLSSAIRVFVYNHHRGMIDARDAPAQADLITKHAPETACPPQARD